MRHPPIRPGETLLVRPETRRERLVQRFGSNADATLTAKPGNSFERGPIASFELAVYDVDLIFGHPSLVSIDFPRVQPGPWSAITLLLNVPRRSISTST